MKSSTACESNTTIMNRILRDMDEGVLTIDTKGKIQFINETAMLCLNLPQKQYAGEAFGPLFIDNQKNDDFVQLIFDALYDKNIAHDHILHFHGSTEKSLKITTSFLFDEENHERLGVVVVINDITQVEQMRRIKNECLFVFTLLVSALCCFMVVWQALLLLGDFPAWIMARVMEILAVIMYFLIKKKTSFSNKDLGLSADKKTLKHTLLFGIGVSSIFIALMALTKYGLCVISPQQYANIPFFEWHMSDDITQATYFFIAPFQEFLSKSVLLGCLLNIFDQNGKVFPLIFSSILFSIFHVPYGLPMMISAAVMNYFLGLLYIKQKNIWGCSIIHFTLGFFGTCFNFL